MSRDLSKADPVLIGLIGRAGSGKTEAASHLEARHGFVAVAFAQALKESVLEPMLATLGIDYAHLYEPHLKNEFLPGYQHASLTPRQLMQEFGDAGRRCAPDWWVDQLAASVGLVPGGMPVHDRIVVSDVRYPNEAAWVLRHGGALIRLHREQAAPVRPHSSEQHIDTLTAHVDLFNHGPTLVGLHGLIDATLADLRVTA
jgi:hypothetical protein